jgi:type I restriction enzyme R subunit
MDDELARALKLDERNHVEKPLLDQLHGLGWTIKDLDSKQHPEDTGRESFTDVVLLPILRQQLKTISDWLEEDQIDEVVKQLTASFPSTSLIQNNRHVFNLLQEGTSVSENRKTGEKSPTVRFIDFTHRGNNDFLAVCQFKVRILGTEHHIIPDIVLFLNGLPVVVIECKSPKVSAVPRCETGREAPEGGQDLTRARRHHLAHARFGQVADHDVYGARDVPAP